MAFRTLGDFISATENSGGKTYLDSAFGRGKHTPQLPSDAIASLYSSEQVHDILGRVTVESNEADLHMFEARLEHLFTSVQSTVSSSIKAIEDDLANLLGHYVQEDATDQILAEFIDFLRNHISDKIITSLNAFGDDQLLGRLSQTLGELVVNTTASKKRNSLAVQFGNTTVRLDLDSFKKHISEQIRLGQKLERVR